MASMVSLKAYSTHGKLLLVPESHIRALQHAVAHAASFAQIVVEAPTLS
jgi:hypothetical protein